MDELEELSREQLLELARGPKQPTTFDPNRPPAVPYVFREFPKMMYRAGSTDYKVVANKSEQDALGSDWGEKPGSPSAAPKPGPEPAPSPVKGKRK